MNSLSEQLFSIEQLVQAIVNQPDDPLYSIIEQGDGDVQVIPTPLANMIYFTVRDAVYPLLQQFPIHQFNPFINVFLKNVINSNLVESVHRHEALAKQHNRYQIDFDYEVVLDVMTQMRVCLDQIRQEIASVEFRKLIYNANRASKKNHDGMIRYIDSLFAQYYQLLVIRVDLSYHQGNAITCPDDIENKYWEAKHDFEHLFNNAKMNRLFEHKVGHIWSLEYGPDKGFHYHLFLFFDGAKVRQDVILAMMIGEYWEHLITGHRGHYFNCNRKKNDYFQCGIGMIHWRETEKLNHLKQAAAYLIKVDHYARLLTPDNGRTFGRGEILSPRTGGPGRPRSYD